MYIAVCDDQAEELSALTALLDQWQAERHFPLRYHTFRSAAGMLDVAQRERFSLYLLDVMMPGIDTFITPEFVHDARHRRHGRRPRDTHL